jgi:hypothetical protein
MYGKPINTGRTGIMNPQERRIRTAMKNRRNWFKWPVLITLISGISFTGLSGTGGVSGGDEGRFKSTGEALYLSFLDDKGRQLDSGLERADEVKTAGGEPEEFFVKPQVKVPVDMKAEKFDQQQVDEGHKPWRLDPVQTTITFVSLMISPGGIEGPFPIDIRDLRIIKKSHRAAIIEVGGSRTPVSRVYLKRLVRQDDKGIWSVVGYDPIRK